MRTARVIRAVLAVVILAVALIVAGCGDDGGDDFSAADLVATGMASEWERLDDDEKMAVAARYLQIGGGEAGKEAELMSAAEAKEPSGAMRTFLREAAVDAGIASALTTTQRARPPEPTTETPRPRPQPRQAPPAPEPRPGYTEESIEYKLAVIDDGYVELDDPKLNQYRALIDRIRDSCSNSRVEIADKAVVARNILRDEIGVEEKTIDELRAFREVVGGLDGKRDCTDAFATYVALRVQQGP